MGGTSGLACIRTCSSIKRRALLLRTYLRQSSESLQRLTSRYRRQRSLRQAERLDQGCCCERGNNQLFHVYAVIICCVDET